MPSPNYQSWIDKSGDNLKWAGDNTEFGNYPLVCYLSQQAVELILKAFLYSKETVPEKTHNLLRLSESCKNLGLDLSRHTSKLALLSEYYFDSRYPDEVNEDLEKKRTAQHALPSAREIVNFVTKDFPFTSS